MSIARVIESIERDMFDRVTRNEKLKTCPFCGGEVTVAISGDDKEQFFFITRGNGENK